MISENSLFLLIHKSGRYLARGYATNSSTKYLAKCGGEFGPPPYGGPVWRLTLDPMDACRARNVPALWQWIPEYYWDREQFSAVAGPVCACCGDVSIVRHAGGLSPYRCEKHKDRNPCAIEGCQHTRAAPSRDDGTLYLANNQALCGEHWRRHIPPRSRWRKAYHAHFRRAKRYGWTPENERAFWLFWNTLVARARRQATEGHIDIAEIHRVMGWDTEAG